MADGAGPSFEEIAETFELMDEWEDRYRYVIELGRALPPLPEARRGAETKVEGCASQVWLDTRIDADTDGARRLYFEGDSDAHIVRGLIAVLRALLNGRLVADAAQADPIAELARLGLDAQLSSQRSNGLRAMVERLTTIARAANGR